MKQTGYEIYTSDQLKYFIERAWSVGDFDGARKYQQALANKREYDCWLASPPDPATGAPCETEAGP